jgi:hypothetical protein
VVTDALTKGGQLQQRVAMTTYDKFYINGQWVASQGTTSIDVIDSITEF